ncbi:MAG: hypothetical protein ACYDIE_00955 [Candidatus Krumholzibacteriia bacterium]
MTDDLDQRLRDIARRDRPRPDHRERLWSALQPGTVARRAAPPLPWLGAAAAAALVVLLASVLTWQDVGTEDFSLTSVPGSAFGESGFTHRQGRKWGIEPRQGATPADQQKLAEELEEKAAASEMTLLRVKGLTLGGFTRLTGIFTVHTSSGNRIVSMGLDDPFPAAIGLPYSERAVLFWSKYGKQVERLIADGSAVYVGETQFMTHGRLVRCDRWRLDLPVLGTVVYWSGEPVP